MARKEACGAVRVRRRLKHLSRMLTGAVLPLRMNNIRNEPVPLSELDEFCHYTPAALSKLSDLDRSMAYDRWFLNGYNQKGDVFFAAAFGTYPGREIVDASFSIVLNGVQHNLRASKHQEFSSSPATDCGPISITVIEPLNKVRLVVDPAPGGIGCDLIFTARCEAVREPYYSTLVAGTKMEYERMTQLVKWEGALLLGGGHTQVEVASWWGTRDRSWGIRQLASGDPSKAKLLRMLGDPKVREAAGAKMLEQPRAARESATFYWLWCPVNMPDAGVLYHCQEICGGDKLDNTNASILPVLGRGGQRAVSIAAAGHEVRYKGGTRHAALCTIKMKVDSKAGAPALEVQVLRMRPKFNFYMSGIGYGHPEWGHGQRHEESLAVSSDTIVLAEVDEMAPLYNHIQAICEVYMGTEGRETERAGETPGIGALEQYVAGMHTPSGLQHAFDTPS